jgi:hypothetical protein
MDPAVYRTWERQTYFNDRAHDWKYIPSDTQSMRADGHAFRDSGTGTFAARQTPVYYEGHVYEYTTFAGNAFIWFVRYQHPEYMMMAAIWRITTSLRREPTLTWKSDTQRKLLGLVERCEDAKTTWDAGNDLCALFPFLDRACDTTLKDVLKQWPHQRNVDPDVKSLLVDLVELAIIVGMKTKDTGT